MEMQLDAPHSDKQHRQADAIAIFSEKDERLAVRAKSDLVAHAFSL